MAPADRRFAGGELKHAMLPTSVKPTRHSRSPNPNNKRYAHLFGESAMEVRGKRMDIQPKSAESLAGLLEKTGTNSHNRSKPSPLQHFTLFESLPGELRNRVWELAGRDLCKPRFVCLLPKVKGNNTPTLLHTCKESRSIFLAENRYDRLLCWYDGKQYPVLFNGAIDTLDINRYYKCLIKAPSKTPDSFSFPDTTRRGLPLYISPYNPSIHYLLKGFPDKFVKGLALKKVKNLSWFVDYNTLFLRPFETPNLMMYFWTQIQSLFPQLEKVGFVLNKPRITSLGNQPFLFEFNVEAFASHGGSFCEEYIFYQAATRIVASQENSASVLGGSHGQDAATQFRTFWGNVKLEFMIYGFHT